MIVSDLELSMQINHNELFSDYRRKLDAIEQVIRAYTNNDFQNRKIRFVAASSGGVLLGTSPFIRIGDTVQISQSGVNDSLYVVSKITDEYTMVDDYLFDFHKNMVTKVEYPDDVKQCAIDLLKWRENFGNKIGIKSESETLSRHSESVTYEDSATLFMGYPVGILNGLALYKKARF